VFHRDSRFQKLIKEQSIIYHFNIYDALKKISRGIQIEDAMFQN
jgi:hypothetical protein